MPSTATEWLLSSKVAYTIQNKLSAVKNEVEHYMNVVYKQNEVTIRMLLI